MTFRSWTEKLGTLLQLTPFVIDLTIQSFLLAFGRLSLTDFGASPLKGTRDTGMIVVRITDVSTGEIVKQVPPQELMDADLNMEKIVGLLVDDEG